MIAVSLQNDAAERRVLIAHLIGVDRPTIVLLLTLEEDKPLFVDDEGGDVFDRRFEWLPVLVSSQQRPTLGVLAGRIGIVRQLAPFGGAVADFKEICVGLEPSLIFVEHGIDAEPFLRTVIALVGTAVIDPQAEPVKKMRELAPKGVRAFRIRPALVKAEKWLEPEGYAAMFAEGLSQPGLAGLPVIASTGIAPQSILSSPAEPRPDHCAAEPARTCPR